MLEAGETLAVCLCLLLVVFAVLDQVIVLLILSEDFDVVWTFHTVRQHLEIILKLDLHHVLPKSVKLLFSIMWQASNSAQVADGNLGTLHDEDLAPEVFEKRVVEELLTKCIVIFSENSGEE